MLLGIGGKEVVGVFSIENGKFGDLRLMIMLVCRIKILLVFFLIIVMKLILNIIYSCGGNM